MKKIRLKEIQKIELEMLVELDRFCRKNNINYYIGCGTLAGAVLRKGFFPWDDDIDVLMKREDYEKFIDTYNNDTFKIFTCKDKNYYYPYAKMINTNTILFECKNVIDNYGVFIDIFPLDGIPNKLYLLLIKPIKLLMKCQWGCYLDNRNIIIRIIYKILSIIVSVLPNNFFAKILNNICKRYSTYNYKKIGVVCHYKYNREIMDRDIFNDFINIEFESYSFMTMKRYEEYLNNLYIDYKVDNGVHGHKHFEAYWKKG